MTLFSCPYYHAGHRTLDTLHWTLDIGHWTQDIGHRTLDTGHWTHDIGHRTLDTGHWTQDIGHRTLDSIGRCLWLCGDMRGYYVIGVLFTGEWHCALDKVHWLSGGKFSWNEPKPKPVAADPVTQCLTWRPQSTENCFLRRHDTALQWILHCTVLHYCG